MKDTIERVTEWRFYVTRAGTSNETLHRCLSYGQVENMAKKADANEFISSYRIVKVTRVITTAFEEVSL